MYMNLKPNKHKIISFNTTARASLGFIGLPLNLAAPQIYFFAQVGQCKNNEDSVKHVYNTSHFSSKFCINLHCHQT